MKFGMLWWRGKDKKQTLEQSVQEAADYYRNKYGEQPTECDVNPSQLGRETPGRVGAVRLVANKTVIADHLWLGDGDTNAH